MIRSRGTRPRSSERKASDWFVRLDAGPASAENDAAFSAWILRDPDNGGAFDRCQAAALLATKLNDRPGSRWMFEESAAIAAAGAQPGAVVRGGPWYARPALAWSIALAATIVATVSLLYSSVPEQALQQGPIAGAMDAGSLNLSLATADPVVILPGEVVVDARSVAILPFDAEVLSDQQPGTDARRIASELYEDILQQLDQLPAVYVADSRSVAAYANETMPNEQIAAQLGVRGVVEGNVFFDEGEIRVVVRMTDVYNVLADDGQVRAVVRMTDVYEDSMPGGSFETSIGERATMRANIANNIVVALSEPVATPGY